MTDITTVKFFDSAQSSAPALSSSAGSLIALLDACLVNGYGSITLDSLVISSNIATATKSTGHGFAMTGTAGPVVRLAGVSVPAALNADWRIVSIPSANTFTFITSGISDQTATGTITAKRAPAGWEKVFSGTNKAVYRALTGTRLYLRVDDSAADTRFVGYESMTDVDTGTDAFPTSAQQSGGYYFNKRSYWRLFADDRTLYLFSATQAWGTEVTFTSTLAFGDINSFKVADSFGAIISGQESSNTLVRLFQTEEFSVGQVSARGADGVTKSVTNTTYIPKDNNNSKYVGRGMEEAYPNPASGGLIVIPYPVWDYGKCWHGNLRGFYVPLHSIQSDGVTETTADGRALLLCRFLSTVGIQAVFDLTGPW